MPQRYKLIFAKDVEKFLWKHPEIIKRFFDKMEILAKDPMDTRLDVKQLKWLMNHRRLRIGKWRFLYEIQESTVLIYFYDADSRGDIY